MSDSVHAVEDLGLLRACVTPAPGRLLEVVAARAVPDGAVPGRQFDGYIAYPEISVLRSITGSK